MILFVTQAAAYKYGEVKYLYVPKAYQNNEFDRIVNEWQVAFKNEGL